MSFNKIVTSLRKSKGVSQYEFSELLKIPRSTYAQYEVGRRFPEYETLLKIADFFEVSLDELVGRKEIEKTKIINESLLNDFNLLTDEDKMYVSQLISRLLMKQ